MDYYLFTAIWMQVADLSKTLPSAGIRSCYVLGTRDTYLFTGEFPYAHHIIYHQEQYPLNQLNRHPPSVLQARVPPPL